MSTPAQGSMEGKVAVVSGAMGDIGRRVCELFAEAGATVIGGDRQVDEGGRVAAEMRERGLTVDFRTLDVADAADVERFGRALDHDFGRVDVLINNAGILSVSPILGTEVEEWGRVQDVNCRAVFLMTKAIAPLMLAGGVILNMSSAAAFAPTAMTAAYSVAKIGVVTFSRVAALELGPLIRVNAICPGALDTQMPRNYLQGNPARDMIIQSMIDRTIVKRLGRPEEIADLVMFLASDKAQFITGAAISADGGFA